MNVHSTDLAFPAGGGDMGARMRAHDWSGSPLGSPEDWPQALRTSVALMADAAQPMFLAWGDELAFLYNDGYADILGAKHPWALGRPFQEVWAEIWPDISPLVERALAGERVWQDDLHLVMERHGYPEETWFSFSYSPARDERGAVVGMFCACVETTRRVLAERQLQRTLDALRESQRALTEERDRLYSLFENAPGFVAALHGPQHVFALANRSYRQLIGVKAPLGRRARDVLPEAESQGFFDLLDEVYRSGVPYIGQGMRLTVQREPGKAPEERYLDFVYQPILERDGKVSGIFVEGADVTERVLFLSQQKLLLDELNHRVKNNLATVQSIAYQTARYSPDLDTFRRTFEARLIALSRTHDVLTANAWESADLQTLLASELEPYGDSRVRLQGPSVRLSAQQALALGLVTHELATNAAKYGALSADDGCVRVTWTIEAAADGEALGLEWIESDGPAVREPTERGFGSRLIERGVSEAGGEVRKEWRAEGVRVHIAMPLQAAG